MADLGQMMGGKSPQNQEQQNLLTVAKGLAAQEAERQRKEEEERRREAELVERWPGPIAAPAPSTRIRWWKVFLWIGIIVVAVFVLLFLVFVGDQLGWYHFPPTSK